MTVIPDTLFDPDLLKKAVLTDRQAREFKTHWIVFMKGAAQ